MGMHTITIKSNNWRQILEDLKENAEYYNNEDLVAIYSVTLNLYTEWWTPSEKRAFVREVKKSGILETNARPFKVAKTLRSIALDI